MATIVPTSLDQLIADYFGQNPRSYHLFERAQKSLPGGNTRTGVFVDPFPIYADHGKGVYVHDVDGNRRLDFVNNATALILGHAHRAVTDAIRRRVDHGTAFFSPTELEIDFAELLRERVPSLERMRFCSSGTEAVLNAIRVARAFTGRRRIAKFEGAYHGIDDPAMVSYIPPVGPDLGPEDRPNPVLSSQGLAPGTAESVVVLPFNNADVCEKLIKEHGEDLAAVIIDPLSTAAGLTLPHPEFLQTLRSVTESLGILLIFDEIVSFRIALGGAQEKFGIRPDLTCLAKVIAGGTPGGAFGGRADVMSIYDPTDGSPGIPQSGTYNGNPLCVVAGLATLNEMTPDAYDRINSLTGDLGIDLEESFRGAGIEASVVVAGSLFRLFFLERPPDNYREAARDSKEKHRWLYFWMMNHGVAIRQGGCVSLPMNKGNIQTLLNAVQDAIKEWPF